jgi:hypothetical protein
MAEPPRATVPAPIRLAFPGWGEAGPLTDRRVAPEGIRTAIESPVTSCDEGKTNWNGSGC